MTAKEKSPALRPEARTPKWIWNPKRGVYENSVYPHLIVLLALPDERIAGELCRWPCLEGLRDAVLTRWPDVEHRASVSPRKGLPWRSMQPPVLSQLAQW